MPQATVAGPLTRQQVEQFHRDGYLIGKGLFDQEEMDLLLTTAKHDQNMLSHGFGVKDRSGLRSKLSLWNHPGDDIYGMFCRCRRMVDAWSNCSATRCTTTTRR